MTELEALKEALCQEAYIKEPLAQALLSYLEKQNPGVHHEILQTFNSIVKSNATNQIKEVLENEEAIKVK